MSDNKPSLNAGKLGVLIHPNLKAREGKDHGRFDFVRGFICCPEKKLGAEFGRRMSISRNTVWNLAFHFYDLLDGGKEKEAWDVAFAILSQYGKPDDAATEAYHEMKRRSDSGENQARKLLDYSQMTKRPVLIVRWSQSQNRVRVETYAEAAERHLRSICMAKNDELAGSYRSYRESMVRHGFLEAGQAKKITDEARAIKMAKEKEKAVAKKAEAKKAPKAMKFEGLAALQKAIDAKKS